MPPCKMTRRNEQPKSVPANILPAFAADPVGGRDGSGQYNHH